MPSATEAHLTIVVVEETEIPFMLAETAFAHFLCNHFLRFQLLSSACNLIYRQALLACLEAGPPADAAEGASLVW
jgi:hypothetical protein